MIETEHISFLKNNEQVIMMLHRHWIIFVFHFIYFIILFISSGFILAYQTVIISIVGGAFYWGGFALYLIIFLTFIFLNWINDELDLFIITDCRVIGIKQISVLSRSVTECSLDQIQEVNAHTKGILQTLFGFGTVHIYTASKASDMLISYAPNPIENTRRINDIIRKYRSTQCIEAKTSENTSL